MNFGKKLKELRLQRTVTQEQLAAYLNISPQAISKWENNLTLPDIQLLPEISVYFGVTIDELFEMTDEKHLQRIENMLDTKRTIDKADFKYAQSFLQGKISQKKSLPRCLALLSALYNFKANEYSSLAEYYATEALNLEPEKKDNHVNLLEAQHGTSSDWYLFSHSKRIQYYQHFVKDHPACLRGYLHLLNELLADSRCDEAEEILNELEKADTSCRTLLYRGKIAWLRGDHKSGMETWQKMSEQFSDDWFAQLAMADCLAFTGQYDKAIPYYQKALELQPSPRYTDAYLSMAQIYEIQRNYEAAIQAWEGVLKLRREEWGYREGEAVDQPMREVARLQKLGKSPFIPRCNP